MLQAQRQWRSTREGRARKGRGAGGFGGRDGGCGAGLGLRGPGGACPPRDATAAAAVVFVQLVLRWRRNWASQWHLPFWGRNWAAQWFLARAVGKRFRERRAKRLYFDWTKRFPVSREPYISREQAYHIERMGVHMHICAYTRPSAESQHKSIIADHCLDQLKQAMPSSPATPSARLHTGLCPHVKLTPQHWLLCHMGLY